MLSLLHMLLMCYMDQFHLAHLLQKRMCFFFIFIYFIGSNITIDLIKWYLIDSSKFAVPIIFVLNVFIGFYKTNNKRLCS